MHTYAACSCNGLACIWHSLPRTTLICVLAYWSVLITISQHFRRACCSKPTEQRNQQDLAPPLSIMLCSVRSGLCSTSASHHARRHRKRKGLATAIDPRNQIEAVEWRIGCSIDEISDSAGGMVYPCVGCDTSPSGERERVVCSGCDCNVRVNKLCISERCWCVLNPCEIWITAI